MKCVEKTLVGLFRAATEGRPYMLPGHLKKSSSLTEASVFSSRYFTMIGV